MVHDCIYLQTYHMHVPDVKDDADNGMNLCIRIAKCELGNSCCMAICHFQGIEDK